LLVASFSQFVDPYETYGELLLDPLVGERPCGFKALDHLRAHVCDFLWRSHSIAIKPCRNVAMIRFRANASNKHYPIIFHPSLE
jgi:hypothetical protein